MALSTDLKSCLLSLYICLCSMIEMCIRDRFMADTGEKFNYKDIFSSEHFFNFEEIAKGSISWIYINNKWKMDLLNDAVARCV